MPARELFWIAALALAVIFAVVWALCTRIRNYGFLDACWSLSIALAAPFYALYGSGLPARRWIFAIAGTLWSLRLGVHILIRVWKHHPKEDPRYETLRRRWPGSLMFLLFFELQALIALVFSLPFLVAASDPKPRLTGVEWAGLVLALFATGGEALADAQAQRFKRDLTNHDRVLDIGLWRYSRHPNYFFESLVWWGFFVAALPSAYGWVTAACPLLMLYFLFRVTGIPITEEHSVRTRGDRYRQYQRTTSMFVPWPPRRTDSSA
jgi:steroid 5-alpha reductase family enzyme